MGNLEEHPPSIRRPNPSGAWRWLLGAGTCSELEGRYRGAWEAGLAGVKCCGWGRLKGSDGGAEQESYAISVVLITLTWRHT